MTTGTKTVQAPAFTGNCGSNARVGWSWSKTWNGTNQAWGPKRYSTVVAERPGYWVKGPKGIDLWIPPKKRTFKKRVWHEGRPPRWDEHPYTCTWSRNYSPWIYWQDRLYAGQNVWSGTLKGTIGTCYGGLGFSSSQPASWSDNDTLALLGKLRERVAGSDINFGVAIAELPQACRMILDAARRIDRAYRSARKGNFKRAAYYLTHGRETGALRRNPKTGKFERYVETKSQGTASNWLELQYGWLPLLNDVYDAASFLSHHLTVEQQFTVRVKRQRAFTPAFVIGSPSNIQPLTYSGIASRRIKAILREKDIAQLTGMLDPLSVIWEKLPYSFVIDWFIPIGTWLHARGLASALSGTFVTSHKIEMRIGGANWLPNINRRYQTGHLEYQVRQGSLERTVSTSLSVPTPSVKGLAQITSWRRAANAVALLTQQAKRLR